MKLLTVFTALAISFAAAAPVSDDCEPEFAVGQIVNTSSGPVAGHAAVEFPEVSEYLGIQFGQAPIGDLRFAAPVKFNGSTLNNGSSYVFNCPPFRDFKLITKGSLMSHLAVYWFCPLSI